MDTLAENLGEVFRQTLTEEIDKWVPEHGFLGPFARYDGAKIVVFASGKTLLVAWGPERYGTYVNEPHFSDKDDPPAFTYLLRRRCVTIRALRRVVEEVAQDMGRYLSMLENEGGVAVLVDNDAGSRLINDIYVKFDRITLEESCH